MGDFGGEGARVSSEDHYCLVADAGYWMLESRISGRWMVVAEEQDVGGPKIKSEAASARRGKQVNEPASGILGTLDCGVEGSPSN